MKTKHIIRLWLIMMAMIVGIAAPILASSVSSWTDLENINNNQSGSYTLTRNLTTSDSDYATVGANFAPISNFTGTFDGQGHTISGLTINLPSSSNVGLFGQAARATIENVGLVNVSVSGSTIVGGLVGMQYQGGIISNCYSTGSVHGSATGNGYVGGLVGYVQGNVINSYSAGSVSGTGNYFGGLVGVVDGTANGTISNSYSTANLNVTGTGNFVGGLVGQEGWMYGGTINNSYATGSVTATGNSIGGLVGQLLNSMMTPTAIYNSFATGVATSTSSSTIVGGLIGNYASGTSTNNQWYNQTNTTGVGNGSPSGVTEASGTSVFYSSSNAPLSSWNFNDTWFARPYNTPVLITAMQSWVMSGGAYLGLSLSGTDITTLMNKYASQSSTMLDGYTWTYMSGILPGDTNGTLYNYGDTWTYNGHKYLKLGSGFEMDPLGSGSDTPEPATVVGMLGMIIAIGLRRFRRI